MASFNRCKYWAHLPRQGKLRCWKPYPAVALVRLSLLCFFVFFRRRLCGWIGGRYVLSSVCFWQAVWQLNEEVKERASEGQGLPIREGVVYLHTKVSSPYPVHSICPISRQLRLPYRRDTRCACDTTDPSFWSIYGKFKRATLLKVFTNILDTCEESPFCPDISYVNCKPRRSVVGIHGKVDVANCALRIWAEEKVICRSLTSSLTPPLIPQRVRLCSALLAGQMFHLKEVCEEK